MLTGTSQIRPSGSRLVALIQVAHSVTTRHLPAQSTLLSVRRHMVLRDACSLSQLRLAQTCCPPLGSDVHASQRRGELSPAIWPDGILTDAAASPAGRHGHPDRLGRRQAEKRGSTAASPGGAKGTRTPNSLLANCFYIGREKWALTRGYVGTAQGKEGQKGLLLPPQVPQTLLSKQGVAFSGLTPYLRSRREQGVRGQLPPRGTDG
jgi:hypothetical protein